MVDRATLIVVMAKAPQAGRVKTRLAGVLGAEGAARLHARLLERTIATAVAAGCGSVELHGTPARHAATREQLRAAYLAAVAAGEEINIHFHVFSRETLTALLALMNAHPRRPCVLTVGDSAEKFPAERGDGFLLVLRVKKPLRARWAAWRSRHRPALLPDARPFLQ